MRASVCVRVVKKKSGEAVYMNGSIELFPHQVIQYREVKRTRRESKSSSTMNSYPFGREGIRTGRTNKWNAEFEFEKAPVNTTSTIDLFWKRKKVQLV